jgi:polysaccharide biosynthesis transport protein
MDTWQLVLRLGRGLLRRRKRLIVLTGLAGAAVLLPLAYVASQEPPRYKSVALLLLESRPDKVPVFQEFSPFRPLPVQLAILRSRSLAETVAETLPRSSFQDLIDSPYHVDYEQMLRNFYYRVRGREPEVESPQRRALKELQTARMGFDVRGDQTGLVAVSAEASKPQVALDIVNTYIEALMARTRSFNIDDTRVTREFLEQQLGDVKKSLVLNEQELQSFLARHGGVKIPERSQATVAQLSQVESALSEVESSRKMLQARVDALRQKAEAQKQSAQSAPATPAAPAAPRTVSPEIQRLRSQLAQLEAALIDNRARFTDEHPRVRQLKDRIAELKVQLGDAVRETVPAGGPAIPVAERVNFADQLVALESSFHSVSAQEDALRSQAKALRQSLNGLSAAERDYARLTRDTDASRSLYAMLSDKLTAARIREQGEMKVVKVIDPPSFPQATVSAKRMRFLGAALALAACFSIALPAGLDWFRRRIEMEDDVYVATGLPVLAIIPRLRARRPVFQSTYSDNGKGPSEQLIFTEAFRTLRVTIQLSARTEHLRTILVTSPGAHEGKSMTVMNLGLAFNEVGKRVVVADADLQRPTLHRSLGVANQRGLVEALHEEQPLEASMMHVRDNMWLVPRGENVHPHTRGVLSTERTSTILTEMADRSDLVLCDSSPVLLIPDNLFLAGAADAVILVAKAGETTCRDLARAKDLLAGAGAKILGVVINEMPLSAINGYYKRYYDSYVKKVAK